VSQRLLPRADGHGRAAALEVMLATGTVRDMIREKDRTPSLHDYIKESREQYGMQTFDQHLMDLVADDVVTYETALAASSNPSDFQLQLKTLRRRSRVVPATQATPAQADVKPAGFTDDLSGMLPQ
jgi:twitching motility protein PilT